MITTCGECPFFNYGFGAGETAEGQHMAVCLSAPRNDRIYVRDDQAICPPMMKSTLAKEWWSMVGAPSIVRPYCVVCGRTYHLNQHHPIRRSAGNLFGKDGRRAAKPTLTLCGNGNTEGCHGLAHQQRLFFDWDGDDWLYLVTKEPVSHSKALSMKGWKPIRAYRD